MLPSPLSFLVDDLAGDGGAVGRLPLRRAGVGLHEGVVDAAAEAGFDVVLGEGERAVGSLGAGVDLAAEDHRFLQRGHAGRGDGVVEQMELGTHRATGELVGVQVGVEAARVGAQRGQQSRVGDGDGAGHETIRRARRREQRHDDGAVHAANAGVDVRLGRRADAAPRDRVGQRVVVNTDEFRGPARAERRPSPRCGPPGSPPGPALWSCRPAP